MWRNLTSTVVLRGRRGTNSHLFVHRFAWQAWHNLTSTDVLRGRRLTHGTGWRPWARFSRAWRPWRRATSAWQAWHLVTSTLISRGRRGTIAHPLSFCVAGASLMALGGALGPGLVARDARGAAPLLRGRRGTWWGPPWFHVAGVAQSHIHGRFAWQEWHLWHWVAPLGPVLSRVTPVAPRHFCVAGVALGDIHLDFTWQEWHNRTSTVVLRGRRLTHGTGWRPWARFSRAWRPWRRATSAWQAWHLVTSTLISHGKRGTIWHPRSFCVAGVALMVLGGALGPGFVA